MVPAYQRFDRKDASCSQFDLRLVEQDELASADRPSQIRLQLEFFVGLFIQTLRVELEIVAAGFFGAIHRCIGVGQETVGVCPVVGIGGDADAACHPEIMSFDLHGLSDDFF